MWSVYANFYVFGPRSKIFHCAEGKEFSAVMTIFRAGAVISLNKIISARSIQQLLQKMETSEFSLQQDQTH